MFSSMAVHVPDKSVRPALRSAPKTCSWFRRQRRNFFRLKQETNFKKKQAKQTSPELVKDGLYVLCKHDLMMILFNNQDQLINNFSYLI